MSELQRYGGFRRGVLRALLCVGLCAPQAGAADSITAFAASSLRDALGDIAEAYEAETGTDVVLVFAATSAIARQVALGAPADVVLLADDAWAQWLIEQGTMDAAIPFAGNRLVLIGREGDPSAEPVWEPDTIGARLEGGILAMAQVDAVPAGRYGKAAFISLGLWDGVASNVVQAANVRAALRFVQRGEADFGVGYASDLVALPDLRALYAFAPDTHPEIIYSGGSFTPQGTDFMTFIQSGPAQDTLSRWGFSRLGASQ